MSHNHAINRRRFCQSSIIGASLLAGLHNGIYCQNGSFSRVVIATRSDLRFSRFDFFSDRISKLLDTAIENYFEKKSPAVWADLFSQRDVVGLKVNCLAGKGLSTHPFLVEAVIQRLLQAGVEAHKIIVWDRLDRDLERAGYSLYYGRSKSQCYGTNRVGYSGQIVEFGSAGSLVSRIISDLCTAVINLPVLKDHGIVGVSVGMKNFFGAINNPNKYHDNIGDPYVADVNMFPDIRNKTRLTICDALTPQYEGGPPFMPQWTWQMDSLMVAQDMVALDYTGWQIIEQQREFNNLPSLEASGRKPSYIHTAADEKHLLGTDDPAKIFVKKV
ncbi:DUF362 domain-containing protein [candidate division KSB1 bacterium]|nr:DUF362 domain-containing protein [candidate division KSB1 bacterium]